MKLPLLLLSLMLAVSCQGKNSKNQASVPTSTPTSTPTPTTPAPTPSETPVPEPETPGDAPWKVNEANCADIGRLYDPTKLECVKIRNRETCEALGNGSVFKIHKCIGPRDQANEINCAALGKKYDQASNDCDKIRTQAECDALGNGSIYNLSKRECIGPKYLPSTENCAAYGRNFDAITGKCTVISTAEECTALNSDALFVPAELDGQRGKSLVCAGRCQYRDSDLDQCHDLYGYKDLDDIDID